MKTPTTSQGLRRYDQDDVVDAIASAWSEPGNNPEWPWDQAPGNANVAGGLILVQRYIKDP